MTFTKHQPTRRAISIHARVIVQMEHFRPDQEEAVRALLLNDHNHQLPLDSVLLGFIPGRALPVFGYVVVEPGSQIEELVV